jgi:hypothetical protein
LKEKLRDQDIKEAKNANADIEDVKVGLKEVIFVAIGPKFDENLENIDNCEDHVPSLLRNYNFFINGVLILANDN